MQIENGTEVQLMIVAGVTIPATVVSSELNNVDNAYHYTLQGQVGDGNTVAAISFVDVVEHLIIAPEEKEQ